MNRYEFPPLKRPCRKGGAIFSFFISFALFACSASLMGCRRGEDPSRGARTLVIGLEGNPTNLDPRVGQDAYSARLFPLIYEGLFIIDKKGSPRPLLARSVKEMDEAPGLSYLIELDPGHFTPEGKEITAGDVVFTFRSLKDPKLRSPRKAIWEVLKAVEARGRYQVLFRLKKPYAPLFTELTLGIVPEEAAGVPGFSARPFGSGPYRVERIDPGARVILVRNPRYHGEAPWFSRLVFRVLPDDVTRVMALERGEVSLLYNSAPPDDLPRLAGNPRLKILKGEGSSYTYLGFNLEDPILKDLRVRRAIAHAIDREKIARCLLRGTVSLAAGILPPSHWAYNPEVKTYDYDPDSARALLDQAGFPDPDGDGPLPRFRLTYKTSQNKVRRWVAEAIADQLAEVGIEVEVRSYEWGTFFSDIRRGAFQLYSLSWVGVTDPDIYYWALHSQSIPPAGANRNRYRNPEFDFLAELGRRETDRERRKRIYGRLQEIAALDLPYVSLWHGLDIAVMERDLSGFEFYPGGDYRSLALLSRKAR